MIYWANYFGLYCTVVGIQGQYWLAPASALSLMVFAAIREWWVK